ncbi:MAG TPA: hypothetical protein VK662_00160 [Acidothermaceae bacterium]|jgi:hypothetical protein|nr:hypothetical protein [Acidothermaceae bacterium]
MTTVGRDAPVIGTSMGGVLVSPGEYSHTTPAVAVVEAKGRSVVGGTTAAAGHCSVAGQLDVDRLVGGVALVGDVELAAGNDVADDGASDDGARDDGADWALRTGGAAHDANAAVKKAATEASPISAADERARTSTKEPPTTCDARG